ncbi:unnamed protein product, partial [Phaeothamnion confervicola]
RPKGRNSWSTLLAVLLGALAGASAFGLSTSFSGGLSIAGQSADTRAPVKPASVRLDTADPSLNLGGLDDPGAALLARETDADLWTNGAPSVLPAALDLPISVARTRDGRSRAPPHA